MCNVPCYNCPDRHMNCHNECSKYQAYQGHCQMVNDARKQANFIHEYFKEAVGRSMKMRRVHG